MNHFYPRPPGGGRLRTSLDEKFELLISIHALRVEGDERHHIFGGALRNISIHALRVEGDPASLLSKICPELISIHALRVEGDRVILYGWRRWIISIHALRVEGDVL